MYYLDENMVKMVTPGAATTPQPVAPAPVATTAPKPVAEPKTGNKRDKKTASTAPNLPAASSSATRLSPDPIEVKTPVFSPEAQLALVKLDEPPPSLGPKPILKPISGGVLNGTAILLPPPVYPEAAKRMRSSGTVVVEVILDESGKVVSANATSGPTILRDAAVQAALKARFSPTKLSGQPVKVSGVINYKFALVP
jgi:protein TonB